MTKESIATPPKERVTRTPLGQRNRLKAVNTDPGYVQRWFNNVDDRISDSIERGWEIVPADKAKVTANIVDNTSSMGSAKEVSVGGGTKAYLMRIKKEWYEDDQKAKQREIDLQVEQLKRANTAASDYGTVR